MSKMLDEIRQQPAALEKTLDEALPLLEKFRAAIAARQPRLVVLAARGTSDNAAQFGRYLIEIATGIPVSLAAPSVHTLYGAKVDYRDALVVGISQSGESTDTNMVLERAREAGAVTVAITNEEDSTMAGLADHVLFVRAGREKSVAATKTYTGQLLLMYVVAHALGAKFKPDQLRAIPDWVEKALGIHERVFEVAGRYRFMEHAVVVGRGLNYANAYEFALKMMETSYVVAERFSSADFLHGPIAMVERDFPAFVFAPSGPTGVSIKEMLVKLDVLGAETLAIADESSRSAAKLASRALVIPAKITEIYTPIPYIVPAQLFAAALAVEKNLNPDRPRTLTKVTQTL